MPSARHNDDGDCVPPMDPSCRGGRSATTLRAAPPSGAAYGGRVSLSDPPPRRGASPHHKAHTHGHRASESRQRPHSCGLRVEGPTPAPGVRRSRTRDRSTRNSLEREPGLARRGRGVEALGRRARGLLHDIGGVEELRNVEQQEVAPHEAVQDLHEVLRGAAHRLQAPDGDGGEGDVAQLALIGHSAPAEDAGPDDEEREGVVVDGEAQVVEEGAEALVGGVVREALEGGGGDWGDGGLGPKVCVPKIARPEFSNGNFRCFPALVALGIDRRWSSPSRITLAFQQYFKHHAAEPTNRRPTSPLQIPTSVRKCSPLTRARLCPPEASPLYNGAPTCGPHPTVKG